MKRLILLVVVTMMAGCTTHHSPTGRRQILLFSPQQMDQMGAQSFAKIKEQQHINRDRRLNQYITCVAHRVTSVSPLPSLPWDVVVFDSKQVNAFALPGGHIGVYTGLLKVTTTPDQLATVIGHEVGHVIANHGNEQISRAQLTGAGLQIADVALDAGGVSNKAAYMKALNLGTQIGILLPYSRDQESEADAIGLQLMAKAGFNPQQSIVLWQNMAKSGGSQGPELLATHPSDRHRIERLEQMQSQVLPLYQASRSRVTTECHR